MQVNGVTNKSGSAQDFKKCRCTASGPGDLAGFNKHSFLYTTSFMKSS